MTLTIELAPETSAMLGLEAARRGLGIAEMARRMIEERLPISAEDAPLDLAEAEALFDRLAAEDGTMPVLPPAADSRAYCYADHD